MLAAGRDINAPVTIGLDEMGVGQELRRMQSRYGTSLNGWRPMSPATKASR
jgi:hypothetical protein